MKTLLILSTVLCVSLSVEAATVVPAEAAVVEQEEKPAPNPEVEAEAAVATGRMAALPQARFSSCLDGWHSFRGNCYLLVNNPENWKNAESYCASFEASLASVHSVWEYHFLQRLTKTGGHAFAWMGGYHFEGEWRWEDGTPFNYNNWESESSTSSYRCLQLSSDESKGWSNHGCNMWFPFICGIRSSC